MSRVSETNSPSSSDKKQTITLPGTVEKIVTSIDPREPEKAEIHIDGADPLYREIRVENALRNSSGQEVKLKKGSHVDVTIAADNTATVPKGSDNSHHS